MVVRCFLVSACSKIGITYRPSPRTPEYGVTGTIVPLMVVRLPGGVGERVMAYSSLSCDSRTLQLWPLSLRSRVGTLQITPENTHSQNTLAELCPRESFHFSLPPYCQRIAHPSHSWRDAARHMVPCAHWLGPGIRSVCFRVVCLLK